MATLLHRLGRWCADRRLIVVAVWAALLALTVSGTVLLAKPLTNEFSIPGSRFEQVLTTLQEEIPEAAGTTGTVVLTSDTPFTDAQKDAVAEAVREWESIEGVTAVDPFEAQDQLDGTAEELAGARTELEQGRGELETAEEQLGAAEQKVEDGRAQLEEGRSQLETGEAQVAEQTQQLEAGQAALDQQLAQLEAGVAAGQVPPAAEQQARAEIAAGQAQLDAGREQLAAARAQLDAAREQVAQGEQELKDGQAQVEEGRTQLESGRTQLEDGEAALAAGERMADLTQGTRLVNEGSTVAMSQVSVIDAEGFIPPQTREQILAVDAGLEAAGVHADFSKEITDDLSSIMGPGEVLGLVVAGLVLVLMLGALLAAGLPLLMALVGVGVGLTGALALTQWVSMNSVTPALALMLGLAVGIDYSLFLINRHRQQLLRGMGVRESIALAVGTSGNAVTFAGLTVIIALSALVITRIPFLGVMGLVAAGTVLVSVLVALTLTPALLSLMGLRVLPRKARRALDSAGTYSTTGEHAQPDHLRGWAAWVQRRPWLTLAGVLVIVAGLAWPAAQLRLGLPDGSAEPAGSTAYQAYDTVREEFGAGANGPIIVVAQLEQPVDEGETALMNTQADIGEELDAVDGVVRVLPAGVSEDRSTLAFQVVPEGGPAEESTEQLVDRLTGAITEIGAHQDATMGLTGQTVANIDISQQLADALPLYLSVVVGLSLILLLLVFRSVLVPLLATGGFLLSVAAAFGAVVAVYQLGHLSPVFDVHEPGPVLSFLPILLIGILFGLAMDYQLFLVSAMRESHVHGEPARRAVVTGFNHSARVVTAAAIIMISVFGGFVWAHLTMIRPIGLGLAVGVLVDAFLVRMTLTPAVMSLLGERAWWLPRWLDRILPDVDVEGAKLERQLAPASPEPPTGDAAQDERELSPSR
ncbi:MMPL family transporter [Ornithinimicrobium avium]|uniref:RND transporter n=1 Tax=Ornithinimicrobium avium TaxID=2283195 RepID=A0A345NR28_9MICO|nr:MMPL family transporter [Ornithinimicrobium avium]AXH97486.1 RND transporter [Ornithinimicrobium avium]